MQSSPLASTAVEAGVSRRGCAPGGCAGALLVPNEGSTARDHLARDRTWIQWVRLSAILLVVAAALALRLRVGQQSDVSHPHDWSTRFAKELGFCFAAFAAFVPIVGTIEYIHTHKSMAKKMGIVQSGFLSRITVTLIALLTSLTCLILFFIDN